MRLIQNDSSPLLIWVAMFLMSSMIMGLVILAIGMVIALPHGLMILAPYRHWIEVAAVVSGAYIATRATQAEIRERRRRKEAEAHIPGEHPRLGAYESWTHQARWTATVALSPEGGPTVDLFGKGTTPSDDEVALWLDHIAPRMEELIAAVERKLDAEGPIKGIGFTISLSPRRVTFCEQGGIEILFDAEPDPDPEVGPLGEFSRNLELLAAYWVP